MQKDGDRLLKEIRLKLFLGTVELRNRTLLIPPLAHCGINQNQIEAWRLDSRLYLGKMSAPDREPHSISRN